ncbi:hypothetical protein BASA50_008296 [Batrachochytrium salamandrivorans]|uniref:RxLR effector protein n=1 Tax=Batrachochytrium salamandrivorans TaxID=1357716 RepID=A0ABQ8F7D7_9FUNG|nr:hypothetical protein BASA50_008296 [Batrachochytrium salamandrivorans]
MKLAIASTTILFAMMAAQAAVLSVAPATDVNLVKRTPNGDEDDEQTPMADQSSSGQTSQLPLMEDEQSQMRGFIKTVVDERFGSIGPIYDKHDEVKKLKATIENLKGERKGKTSCEIFEIDDEISDIKKELANLEKQLKTMIEEHELKVEGYQDIKRAKSSHDYNHLRGYLQNE